MADGPVGPMTGFFDAQQAQDLHAQSLLQVAEGKQKMELSQLTIDRTKLEFKRQEAYIEALRKLSERNNTPGGVPPSSASAQAQSASDMYNTVADAALHAGLPEEARVNHEVAAKLAENASLIDLHEAEAAHQRAGYVAHQMKYILEAKDDPQEAQRRWNAANMGFSALFGQKSQYAGVPYSEELVRDLLARSETSMDEANLKYRTAEQKRADMQTRYEEKGVQLRDAQIARTREQTKKLQKEGAGPKVSKTEQARADALDSSINILDDIESIIEANPDESLTGFMGAAHGIAESVKGALGSHASTPSRDVQADIKELERNMLDATRGYTSKAKMEIIKALADIQAPGMGGDVGKRRLKKLRDLLEAERSKSPVKREQDDEGLPHISDDAEYDALPPGAEFVDPEGNRRKKP